MATLKLDAAATRELARGTETILVAEDDEALRSLPTMTLEDAGYTVIVVADGSGPGQKKSCITRTRVASFFALSLSRKEMGERCVKR